MYSVSSDQIPAGKETFLSAPCDAFFFIAWRAVELTLTALGFSFDLGRIKPPYIKGAADNKEWLGQTY
jgi:hypothetical protein